MMDYLIPVTWLGLTIVFAILEALTVGLVSIWFAGGSLVALIVSLLGGPLWLQSALFLGVSFGLLIGTRRVFVAKLKTGSEKTNVDALIGETALVTTSIKPFELGKIKLKGMEWSAVSELQEVISEGSIVEVVNIEGVKAIVKQVK